MDRNGLSINVENSRITHQNQKPIATLAQPKLTPIAK